jgi:hypothetical protein
MVKIVDIPEADVFDKAAMQANFSAVLYLLTEQQALAGRLLSALLEQGTLTSHQIAKITDITDGEEGLIPTYTQLYNRFATYYLRTKAILDDAGMPQPVEGTEEEKDDE